MCKSIFKNLNLHSWKSAACLSVILLFVTWLYAPFVNLGTPYFYDEDEGHHFNRVVEMVKKGSFDPEYFLKPSLHFYLRMPVTALAFLHIAKNGEIKSIKDVKTTDSYGLANYSFVASHPFIMKANRIFSLMLTIGSLALVFLISLQFTSSLSVASLTTLLTSFSSTLAERSAFIGVDGPTLFFALLTIYTALLLQKKGSLFLLISSCILAGFTISTKYNAAPIYLVPLTGYLLSSNRTPFRTLLAFSIPCLAFFAASPFILASIPLFLDHVAYEMWHYKTGHEGHMAEPGLAQALFYLKWIWQEGWYIIPVLILPGLYFAYKQTDNKKSLSPLITISIFPLIYSILMLTQRVNFTRNMIIVLPFIALFSAIAIYRLCKLSKKSSNLLFVFCALLICTSPFYLTFKTRQLAVNNPESRFELVNWLLENKPSEGLEDIALSGKLQLPQFKTTQNRETVRTLNGITRIKEDTSFIQLYQEGFDKIIVGPEKKISAAESAITKLTKIFNGSKDSARVYKNPEIRVFEFKDNIISTPTMQEYFKHSAPPTIRLNQQNKNAENWIQTRLSTVIIPSMSKDKININLFTPWEDTTVSFKSDSTVTECHLKSARWNTCSLPVSKENKDFQEYEIFVPRIHTPANQGNSNDSRRLGVAIRLNN